MRHNLDIQAGSSRPRTAFTLVEMMAATVILSVILLIIFSITQQISQAWIQSTGKIEAFQAARAAHTTITQQLGSATLNTYYEYFDADGKSRAQALSSDATFQPKSYGRYSDLHFVSGKSLVPGQVGHSVFFQSPAGYTADDTRFSELDLLLNECGFYVRYDKDTTRPGFLETYSPAPAEQRHRFRLMQFLSPAEELQTYKYGNMEWFLKPLANDDPPVRELSENVVAVLFVPKRAKLDDESHDMPLTSDFEYNTRPSSASPTQREIDHQLPPVMEVILITMDEPSALRFCNSSIAPTFGVTNGISSLFQKVADLETDLAALKAALEKERVAYRIFRTQIALRGSKWSS